MHLFSLDVTILEKIHFPQKVYKLSKAKFSHFEGTRVDKKQIFRTLFSSQFEISHVLNGATPKFNTENEEQKWLTTLLKYNDFSCLAFTRGNGWQRF
jgi:hypothetical protein